MTPIFGVFCVLASQNHSYLTNKVLKPQTHRMREIAKSPNGTTDCQKVEKGEMTPTQARPLNPGSPLATGRQIQPAHASLAGQLPYQSKVTQHV